MWDIKQQQTSCVIVILVNITSIKYNHIRIVFVILSGNMKTELSPRLLNEESIPVHKKREVDNNKSNKQFAIISLEKILIVIETFCVTTSH
jgi:hypothetical protein